MKKFEIRYGLGGGFGGAGDWEEIEADSLDDAINQAYEYACQEYDQYDGLHGLLTINDIMEEEGCDYDYAEQVWMDDRESWIEYEAREVQE